MGEATRTCSREGEATSTCSTAGEPTGARDPPCAKHSRLALGHRGGRCHRRDARALRRGGALGRSGRRSSGSLRGDGVATGDVPGGGLYCRGAQAARPLGGGGPRRARCVSHQGRRRAGDLCFATATASQAHGVRDGRPSTCSTTWRWRVASLVGSSSDRAWGEIRDRSQRILDRLSTPTDLLAADPATLRAAGLSQRKIETLRTLASRFADGSIRSNQLHKMSDGDIEGPLSAQHPRHRGASSTRQCSAGCPWADRYVLVTQEDGGGGDASFVQRGRVVMRQGGVAGGLCPVPVEAPYRRPGSPSHAGLGPALQ